MTATNKDVSQTNIKYTVCYKTLRKMAPVKTRVFHLKSLLKTQRIWAAGLKPQLTWWEAFMLTETWGGLCCSSSHPCILPHFPTVYLYLIVHPLLVKGSRQSKQSTAWAHVKMQIRGLTRTRDNEESWRMEGKQGFLITVKNISALQAHKICRMALPDLESI